MIDSIGRCSNPRFRGDSNDRVHIQILMFQQHHHHQPPAPKPGMPPPGRHDDEKNDAAPMRVVVQSLPPPIAAEALRPLPSSPSPRAAAGTPTASSPSSNAAASSSIPASSPPPAIDGEDDESVGRRLQRGCSRWVPTYPNRSTPLLQQVQMMPGLLHKNNNSFGKWATAGVWRNPPQTAHLDGLRGLACLTVMVWHFLCGFYPGIAFASLAAVAPEVGKEVVRCFCVYF